MTRISCDTVSANDGWRLHALVPGLRHLMAPAAELSLNLDRSMLFTCPPSPPSLLVSPVIC